MSIYKEPPPGMFVVPDPHDMTKVREDWELLQLHALLHVAVDSCSKDSPEYFHNISREVRGNLVRAQCTSGFLGDTEMGCILNGRMLSRKLALWRENITAI